MCILGLNHVSLENINIQNTGIYLLGIDNM